jgi:hypothetical protein
MPLLFVSQSRSGTVIDAAFEPAGDLNTNDNDLLPF